jgi:hypothetical protein
MPFGLCNAPSTFQRYINSILRDYLDEFCSAYLDDVIVFSENKEIHKEHCMKVLVRLKEAGLHLDIHKCEFAVSRVKYLGLILTADGIEMDTDKVRAVLDWLEPQSIKDVQAFIGFANFYRRFIHRFSFIVRPLIELIKLGNKGERFAMTSAARAAFESLKIAFSTTPVLVHFDPNLKSIIETDASDWVVSGILSQYHDGVLRPVAYFSMKMSPAECNYPIYDKELLAIIKAFEEWRPEVAGTDDPIEVFSDHKALEWFMSSKQLNRRQARWSEFLSEFNFVIHYRPGKQGTKPDSLTRRPGDLPANVTDDRIQHQCQTILSPHRVDSRSIDSHGAVHLALILTDNLVMSFPEVAHELYLLSELLDDHGYEDFYATTNPDASSDVEDDASPEGDGDEDPPCTITDDPLHALMQEFDEGNNKALRKRITDSSRDDKILKPIRSALTNGLRTIPHGLTRDHGIRMELKDCTVDSDGILYYRKRIVVPSDDRLRSDIIKLHHDSLATGHGGKHATYHRLSRYYYWTNMTDTVAQYVKNCLVCARAKPHREGKHGYLNPLPIPDTYWTDLSVDFITPLPKSHCYGRVYQHIMVVVDRLSKKKKFIPLQSLDVEAVVQGFIEHVWREEGYPVTIVSDRGSQFVSHFWKRLCQRIGTTPLLSTTAHPETDGQTEIVNAWLKQYLRAYIHYDQSNWAELLPFAEFAANSDKSSSTGLSPFEATKGYRPRDGSEPVTPLPSDLTGKAKRDARAADSLLTRITDLKEFLTWNLSWSRSLMERYANRSRHPAPLY